MEPMDLDTPHQHLYRSNSVTATNTSPRVFSPNTSDLSDMEIDPNSPPPPIPHTSATNRRGNSGCTARIVSSPSLDCVNQSLCDILSLRDVTPHDNNPQQNHQNQSAPPVVSPFFQKNKNAVESNLNSQSLSRGSERSKPSLGKAAGSSNLTTPRSRSKTGYGIRDDDIVFSSNYPLSPSSSHTVDHNDTTDLGCRLTQRSKCKSSSNPGGMSCVNKGTSPQSDKNIQGYPTVIKFLLFISSMCLVILLVQTILVSSSCDNKHVFQSKVLEVDLKTDLFGQHIASTLIQKHIKQYFELYHLKSSNFSELENRFSKRQHCRPLVLSFHGWTGVGKNFGSQIVSQSFSQVVVHPLIVPLLFPHIHRQDLYTTQIQDWIISNVTQCCVNLFIIDEMDKALPGVQKGLLKAIQALTSTCTTSTSPVVFILISNTQAAGINQAFVELSAKTLPSKWDRTVLKEEDFHSLFKGSSSKTHPWYSDLAALGLIDAFIPFLPLEKRHVTDCIKRELVSKHLSTDSHTVSQVLKELSFSRHKDLELSTTGCKRVADKVNYVIYNKGK